MSHAETYIHKYTSERFTGNNYDIVLYMVEERCLECGTLVRSYLEEVEEDKEGNPLQTKEKVEV